MEAIMDYHGDLEGSNANSREELTQVTIGEKSKVNTWLMKKIDIYLIKIQHAHLNLHVI